MEDSSSLRPVLRLLGNNARLKLLVALTCPPMTIVELADATGISDASARYHVKKLHLAGLLESEDLSIPHRYRPSDRVRVVRYRGKTVCSVEARKPEKIIFSIPDNLPLHKARPKR